MLRGGRQLTQPRAACTHEDLASASLRSSRLRNATCCSSACRPPTPWLQDLLEDGAGMRGRITVYCVAESLDRKVRRAAGTRGSTRPRISRGLHACRVAPAAPRTLRACHPGSRLRLVTCAASPPCLAGHRLWSCGYGSAAALRCCTSILTCCMGCTRAARYVRAQVVVKQSAWADGGGAAAALCCSKLHVRLHFGTSVLRTTSPGNAH